MKIDGEDDLENMSLDKEFRELDEDLKEELDEDLTEELDEDLERELDALGRTAIESLNWKQVWITRLLDFYAEVKNKLWKAIALGGDETNPDDPLILEFICKAEIIFRGLRCSLVDTEEAFMVIEDSIGKLERAKSKWGGGQYCFALLDLIDAVVHELKLGFKISPQSKWNFDENNVSESYRIVLQKEYCPKKVSDEQLAWALRNIQMEVKKVDAGDNLYSVV